MSTSLLYHAFGIRGYDYVRTDYQGGATIFTIRQDPHDCRCSACGSREVISRGHAERQFAALPIGSRKTTPSSCPSRVSSAATVGWCARSRSPSPTRGGRTPRPSRGTSWNSPGG